MLAEPVALEAGFDAVDRLRPDLNATLGTRGS